MTRLIFFILIFSFSTSVFSQRSRVKNLQNYDNKPIHFGFAIGVNTMDFQIFKSDAFFDATTIDQIYSITNYRSMGFHLGPISNLRLGEYFDLRFLVNLSFSQRSLTYTIPEVNSNTYNTYTMKLASTYLEFPLLIKYKAFRINNYRPYVIAGVNPKYDLAARKKPSEDELPKIQLKQLDPCYEVGFGIDTYLKYFKFSIEIKYSAGIQNVMIHDDTQYTKSIKKMTSNAIMISFLFE